MRENLLEECYEVLEAIDDGDEVRLRGELGDLLMQIVFHARIANENDSFELADVIRDINEKLIRRHPHVFKGEKVDGTQGVLSNWEEIKKGERGREKSVLSGVPPQMPSLAYSQEIQARAARLGFDWEEDRDVIEKIAEEATEIATSTNKEEKAAEYGDLLFAIANLARRQNIDLESGLRQAGHRFKKRFTAMEKMCCESDTNLAELSFSEQNKLWEEAKKEEG
jgi:tetrapyrrole methylase family protein/MazG family protein